MSLQTAYILEDEEFFDDGYEEFEDYEYWSEDNYYGDVDFSEATALSLPINPGTVVFGIITAVIVLFISLLKISSTLTFPEITSQSAVEEQNLAQEIAPVQGDTSSVELSVASSTCAISSKYPDSILQWCGLITKYADKRGLPADLVAALIWQESGGNPVAYSSSGAVGLMQVMPRDGLAASFMCVNGPCFSNRPSIQELKDPEFNISYGTKMLASLLSKKGNYREALKSYGPMDVGYYYADKVLGIFQKYGK
jgi:hypothetical protein